VASTRPPTDTFTKEVSTGRRFEFGKNWTSFLSTLSDERIGEAEKSLRDMLKTDDLEGKRFLDVGSGSGLFSLAARRMGAVVHSFDYDPSSVGCTQELRSRFFPNDPHWTIERGSVLDSEFLASLGQYDIVYSWGVLHHTGDMWTALDNVAALVGPEGILFIAIYNDQGMRSKVWWRIKKTYCSSPVGKLATCGVFIPYFFSRTVASSLLTGTNQFSTYKKRRGMSITHDWTDWLGGYPYEVATVDQLTRFYESKGFTRENMKSTSNLGNNQLVFRKSS